MQKEVVPNTSAFLFGFKTELLKLGFWQQCGGFIGLSGLHSLSPCVSCGLGPI